MATEARKPLVRRTPAEDAAARVRQPANVLKRVAVAGTVYVAPTVGFDVVEHLTHALHGGAETAVSIGTIWGGYFAARKVNQILRERQARPPSLAE